MKSNAFLHDDWVYYSAVTLDRPSQNIHFDVASVIFSLFDQDRAMKGTPATLQSKLTSRAARRATLNARVRQLLTASNIQTKAALRNLRDKMPADLFAELYPTFTGGNTRRQYKGNNHRRNTHKHRQ
jgi:hypothetical protein